MTYTIAVIREFYGPKTEEHILADYFGNELIFPTRQAAEEKIAQLDAEPYTLGFGESARPTYKVQVSS